MDSDGVHTLKQQRQPDGQSETGIYATLKEQRQPDGQSVASIYAAVKEEQLDLTKEKSETSIYAKIPSQAANKPYQNTSASIEDDQK